MSATTPFRTPLALPLSQYEDLFHVLPYGVLRYDSSGHMLEANPAALNILGINLKQLARRQIGDTSWQFADHKNRPMKVEQLPLSRAMRTGKPVKNVTLSVYNPKTHRHVWVRCQAVPHTAGADRPPEYWIIFHDITDEFQAETALRESQSNLALAQRVASIGSAVFDFGLRRWSCSAELMRIFGVDSLVDTQDPETMASFVNVEDRESYLRGVEQAMKGVVPPPREFKITRADKTQRIIYREVELVSDPSRGWRGVILVHKDITARRESENQREELQKQLHHAQRLESLGTLASGIAHDLNNTLVPILGLSQALVQSPRIDESERDLLGVIESAGARARNLVQQVLAFSRKDRRRGETFNLADAVAKGMKLARATISPLIALRTEIEDVGEFQGDPTQIDQLLLNLISNSSFAIGEEPGWISVSLRQIEWDCRNFIELEVADSGVGMDPEVQRKIFEPFFTTKAVGAGTGLGLSVVHGIVRSHSGTIDVTSKVGEGSRFVVRLPKFRATPGA